MRVLVIRIYNSRRIFVAFIIAPIRLDVRLATMKSEYNSATGNDATMTNTCLHVYIHTCIYIYIYIYIYIQGVRFVRDQTKSDDRLGQTKKKIPLPFCKIRNNY